MDWALIIGLAGVITPLVVGLVTHQVKVGSATKTNSELIRSHIHECHEDKKVLRQELRDDFNRVHDRLDQISRQ